VYLLLSIAIFFLGRLTTERFLGDFSKYMLIIGGGFIISVGLLMSLGKRLELKFCYSFQKSVLERDKKSILIFGFIIGLLPCAPLLAVLSYIGLVSKSWSMSLLYGLSFGIGTVISPLILLVIIAGIIPKFLIDKSYDRWFNLACGLIIIFLGAQLILRAF
jgi:sulfite exporter TauE/SafE